MNGNLQPKFRYISAADTARMTGLSVKTLEAMRAQRRGPPFYRLGRPIRYRDDEVQAWMERYCECAES